MIKIRGTKKWKKKVEKKMMKTTLKLALFSVEFNWFGGVISVLPVVTHSFESVPTTRVATKNPDCVNVEYS